MKKFTKVCLIIVAVMAGVGILLCGIASLMGAGFGTMRMMADNGDFNLGNWHIGDKGFYYDSDDDWNDEDWDDEDENENFLDSTEQGTSGFEKSMQFALSDVKDLKLDVEAAEIAVKEAESTDQITVTIDHGKEKYYSCSLDGNVLKVKYDTENHFMTNNYHGPLITISIPKGASFGTLDFDIGAAETEINVSELICETLKIDVGAGTLEAEEFSVSQKADITIGAGTVDIDGGEYGELKLDCGMGTFDMNGKVNGDIKGHCGMGTVALELKGEKDNYNYDLSCGMGELKVNDKNYSSISGSHKEKHQDAIGTISLDCGMGSVDVQIK